LPLARQRPRAEERDRAWHGAPRRRARADARAAGDRRHVAAAGGTGDRQLPGGEGASDRDLGAHLPGGSAQPIGRQRLGGDATPNCDRGTGCIAPDWPFGDYLEQLPPGKLTDQWNQALDDFEACRLDAAQGGAGEQSSALGESQSALSDSDFSYVKDKVLKW